MPATKKCSKCGGVKEVGEFYKNKHRKDGLSWWCKKCDKLKSANSWGRLFCDKNRYDKYKQERKKKRLLNRDKLNKWARERYQRKKDDINFKKNCKNARKKWYDKHGKKKCTDYRNSNRLQIRINSNKYYHKKSDEILWKNAKRVESLSDSYIKQLLAQQFNCFRRDITKEMMKLKRLQIEVRREKLKLQEDLKCQERKLSQ